MQSPAAVALSPRLTAILRFDRPLALSRNTSRIFRMGSLSWGMPSPFERRARQCRFEPYPTGAPYLHTAWSTSTGISGRHRPEPVAVFNRNDWSSSTETAGRHRPEPVVVFNRNDWSSSTETAGRHQPVCALHRSAGYLRGTYASSHARALGFAGHR